MLTLWPGMTGESKNGEKALAAGKTDPGANGEGIDRQQDVQFSLHRGWRGFQVYHSISCHARLL
jgi:hypothetical protein